MAIYDIYVPIISIFYLCFVSLSAFSCNPEFCMCLFAYPVSLLHQIERVLLKTLIKSGLGFFFWKRSEDLRDWDVFSLGFSPFSFTFGFFSLLFVSPVFHFHFPQ